MIASDTRWCLAVAVAATLVGTATTALAQSPAPPANSAPRLVHFVQADYPPDARTAGLEANVVLTVDIGADGHVTDATVSSPVGHGFDAAAVAAVRQFEFVPAQQNGQPAPARIRYRYRFTLRESASPPPGPAAVLRGVVRDAQNHPLANAVVEALLPDSTTRQEVTNDVGEFRIEVAQAGNVSVDVRAEGFRDYHSDEVIHDRDDVQAVYRLLTQAPAASSAPASTSSSAPEQEVTVRTQRPERGKCLARPSSARRGGAHSRGGR